MLEDILDWVLFTSSTTCFIKADLVETLSSRTRILFTSNVPVMWCKSARLVHNWDSDQSWLIGIETQHLFPSVIYWLPCRHAQLIDHNIVQTPDPFPRSFVSWTSWNKQSFRTMNTHNLSNLKVFQSFSLKCKILFLQSWPKEFLRECIVYPLKENLLSIKQPHVTNFEDEVRPLFLKRITWKQRADFLASDKGLQLIKVLTPLILNHFFETEQFVLVLVSTYNKSLNTQPGTKQELPKYQPLQNPT